MNDCEVILKAEDIAHVLRDGVALLPGSRDRTGRAIIVFPPKEHQLNSDNIRNILRYLHTVTADDTKELGFTVIIDMRGKHASNNVRPILKSINHLCETTNGLIIMVLIIKPDTFWEKQKANMLLGSWSFEVHMISIDALSKFIDPSQLIRDLGGSFPYDHDDWLDTRLELERWIWQISEVMRNLECQRRSMADAQFPVDVTTAESALSQHSSIKKAIFSIPIDRLQSESDRISERINRAQCGISNPDLMSSIPHMANLLTSLRSLKNDVFKQWETRRVELEGCYQMKLFEHDADEMLDWTRKHCDALSRRMGDIGVNDMEASEKLREFEEFSTTADSAEVNITQVTNIAIRLRSIGGQNSRNKLERTKLRLEEEWARFQEQLVKRKLILGAAVAFFSASKVYFSQLPSWVDSPGVDPAGMSGKTADVLEEAIQQHEKFWSTVEETYAEAVAQGSQLTQLLKSVDVDDPPSKDQIGKITRAHKHLLCLWKERRVRLHSMLALIAFRTDTQLVVEWLEQHGDPYLTKNTSIGETVEQARTLQRNHSHFRQIARNTYSNANKLFEASKAILESGVCDAEKMRAMIGDLDQRVQQFTQRVEARFNLLNQSVLFHTHYHEIMAWYDEMEKKYAERVVDSEVEACERSKEQWLYESDGTAQAYATTIGEGTQLVRELEVHSQHTGIDYTSNMACINRLIRNIESRNSKLSNIWNPQRVLLQIGLRFAVFVRDNCEVLSQIRSWEEDMRGMLESSTFAGNAEKVLPFHQDNTAQVKMAVKNIRKCAQEVLQSIHGNGFSDLRTRQGKSVTDLIRENLKILEVAEHQVMQYAAETSYRIEGSRKLGRIRNVVREIVSVFDREERALQVMSTVPVDLEQALRAQEAHELFIKRIELNNMDSVRVFYELSNELIREGSTDRSAVVELNEMVTGRWRRLSGLAEERNKLLKAAIVCYKTYLTGVYPILDQLEKDYSQNPDRDWCAVRVGETPQERVNVISELLSKHMDYKDRFLKGCIYAQKTSELFLKYIERTSSGTGVHNRLDSERIIRMKSDLRERQSKILELWTKKKKQLDRCQQFVLMDATRHVLVDWLCGEGERRLTEFMGKGVADAATLEDFHTFKLAVKEERAKIQTLLCMAGPIRDEAKQHAADIADCMDDVRLRFEKFSRRVAECETLLRGGKPIPKDDLSLDRLSDPNVEENMNIMKREQNKKLREPMHELIKSERDYIEDLRKCIQVYIAEFDSADANSTLPPILKDRRQAIFGNYEKLYAFHSEKFFHELSKYEDDPEEVGCSFTVWVDYLNELYTDYCVNMEQNNHVVALPEVMSFFESIREKHGLEQNNSLHSMRIKPVQRCTRYKLLMEQLLKHCSNVEEIREAYDVVKSLPRRVNDIIHFNGLEKDKLGVVGPFVMQDLLTVWEPRNYFNKAKGKDRQVFLFEQAIVIAKKVELTPKNVKYIIKGKPIPLADVSVVEHVEGDACRFGLRIGTVASNENRIDLRSAPQPKEEVKIMWVKRIRELTQTLLPLNLGVGLEGVPSSGSSGPASVSTRSSNASTNSVEYESRDTDETSSLESQRLSLQSMESNQQQPSEHWIVSVDFDDRVAGHLCVRKGERVEMLEQQPNSGPDWVHVAVIDEVHRTGLVPCSILLPDAPSSSCTDRPDTGTSSGVVKRKSLRRIFGSSNPAKDHQTPSSPTNRKRLSEGTPRTVLSSCDVEPSGDPITQVAGGVVPDNTTTTTATTTASPVIDGVLSTETDSNCCQSVDEGLPPPMDEITLNNSHMNEDAGQEATGAPTEEMRDSVEEECPEKQEKTPEEMARLKRQYVLMELVETEKDYVRDLSSVVDGYIANLERMELPADLVGKDKIIFANIAQILEFHKNSFLKEIEKCLDNYEVAGSAFVKYKGRLETMYVRYCQNKPKSDYLVSQEDFEQFFAETKAKLGHKVALSDLLIKPVQRIMKYQLLLKDILKFTERAKDKTDMLKKALVVMHVVPKACDDMMQVGRLQNFDGSLNAQGKLLYQGTLPISDSQGGTSQKSKDRRIFLFEQSVIIADHIPPKKEFGNPIYIFKNQIMVNKMLFEPSVPDDPLKFIIRSSDPAQPTAFIATAQTQEEKNEWVRYISEQLDQQKRMLAALVDPRRFMGGATDDLSGSMAGIGLGGDGKKSPSGGSGGGGGTGSSRHNANSGSSKGGSGSKPDSPKKESKGTKLFGFGKKASAKSPTSPPPEKKWSDLPLRGVACCAYHHLRKGEVDLEPGEQVDILEVFGGFSHVLKKNGQDGSVPSYFLELVDIPGDTLAEQIEYRRMWHAIVDEVIPTDSPVTPLSSGEDIRAVVPIIPDGRPVFVIPLADVNVCEGDRVVLRPEISSTTPFTVTWRGPAVEAGRAEVKSDGESTSLIIKKITALDYGPYSVVAKNDYGIASSVSVVKVITHPDPPASLVCERIGRNALLLTWNPGFRKGLYYGVEFQSEDMGQYRCVASALRTTTISLRHFRPVRYRIRVFSYNFGLRSRPSKEVEIDFSKRISLLENAAELSKSVELGEVCGRGRFCTVHDGTLLKTQRNVSVKMLLAEVSKTDVEREVAVLSVLHHSSMPRLKGVFTSDGRYCIAMKKMPGVGISAYVDEFVHMHDESGELERLLRRLSGDILGALSYLHARDIVHLDVKPLNLLVSDHVYLIDFGCARFVDDEEALAWTDSDKSYSAPERIAGKPPSTASDIWSFGAVLFELCFGVAPHHMLPTLTTNPEQRSPALLSFLNEVLALEASRRPTAEECLQKGWFKKVTHLEVPHETREFSRSVSFEG